MNQQTISDIQKYGKKAKGKKELIKHLEGGRLTLKQAVNAHCYDCMGFYADGKQDCKMPKCPLYRFMAYNKNESKRIMPRTISERGQQCPSFALAHS